MTVYMKCDGVSGSVTAKNYQEHIELIYVQNPGFSLGVHTPVGTTQNRSAGKPACSPIIITKQVDQSSAILSSLLLKAQSIPTVTLKFVTVSGGKYIQTFAEWELSDVLISHHSEYFNGQTLIETFVLDYRKIVKSFTPRDSKNRAKSPVRMGYDRMQAEVL